jgi:FtsH-binding integral membrane protein
MKNSKLNFALGLTGIGAALGIVATVSAAFRGSIYSNPLFHIWIFSPFYIFFLLTFRVRRNPEADKISTASIVGVIGFVALAVVSLQIGGPDPNFAVGLLICPVVALVFFLTTLGVMKLIKRPTKW